MLRSLLVACCLWCVGCPAEATDRQPVGALRLFLEAMGETGNDPSARMRAYELLAPEARARLATRARAATAVSGRTFHGHEMIVESRYRLRFRPRASGGFVEHVDGDRAIVTVRGDHPGERADVPMVREGSAWRVDLAVPEADARGHDTPEPP